MNSSIGARPADDAVRLAGDADPAASRTVDRSSSARHASACSSAANTDRGKSRSSSRNSAARLAFDRPAVGAQVGLVGAVRAQHERPGRRGVAGEHPGGEDPRGHVDPLQRAAQDQEQPASSRLIVASARPTTIAEPLADEPEQRVRAVPAGHRALLRQRVVGDVQRTPRSPRESTSRAPRAFSRAADSAPTIELGLVRSKASSVEHAARCRPSLAAAARPSAPAGRRRPGARRSTGPRRAAGGARRGCGWCRRRARRSGRSRTSTRRSGSARRAPLVAAAAAVGAGRWRVSLGGAGVLGRRLARAGPARRRTRSWSRRARRSNGGSRRRRGGQHPGVLGAAALAGVHHQARPRAAPPGSARRAAPTPSPRR